MKWEEAYEILSKKYKNMKPLTCKKYDGKFIFTMIPSDEDFDPMKHLTTYGYYVEEITKETGIYYYPEHGTDEFNKEKNKSKIIFDNRNWY